MLIKLTRQDGSHNDACIAHSEMYGYFAYVHSGNGGVGYLREDACLHRCSPRFYADKKEAVGVLIEWMHRNKVKRRK